MKLTGVESDRVRERMRTNIKRTKIILFVKA